MIFYRYGQSSRQSAYYTTSSSCCSGYDGSSCNGNFLNAIIHDLCNVMIFNSCISHIHMYVSDGGVVTIFAFNFKNPCIAYLIMYINKFFFRY